MKTNNAGYIIGAYPRAPSFTKEVKRKRRISGDNYLRLQTFWVWNNLAWKIFTLLAINGYSVIRQRAGNLSSPQ